MEPNELNALSALLAEDDFAKGVALGISAEKAARADRRQRVIAHVLADHDRIDRVVHLLREIADQQRD